MTFSKPDGWDILYFDWDRLKVTYFLNDETEPRTASTLRSLTLSLDHPTIIIGEATFENYNLHERKSVFDLAILGGHLWFSIPNRATYRWRNRLGWKKNDEIDARVIRLIAEYPGKLKQIRAPKTEGHQEGLVWVYDPLPLNHFDEIISANLGKGPYARLREVVIKDPDTEILEEGQRRELFKEKQAEAMEFRRLSDKLRAPRILAFKKSVLEAVGSNPGTTKSAINRNFSALFPLLNDPIAWTAAFAANAADNDRQFDSLLGAHAHGAKSMMRSQFYFWGWACNGNGPMFKGSELTDYRRQVRQLGSLVHKHNLQI